MAGVRIYCRGKIAAQTSVFNRGAGFTGEHNIRSYLVGEIFADWLDEGEDLIQTDRKDIIWSDELGECFEIWGQNVVLALGKRARNPLKKRAWEQFLEVTQIKDKIEQAFTGPKLKSVRDKTLRLAKAIGESYRPEQLEDSDQVDSMVNLVMMFGPHVELDEALLEAGKEEDSPLSVVVGILERAKVAELSSFGLIAEKRVRVIQRLEALKDDPNTIEQGLQELIEEAPWLINPQWSPIIENQSLSTLKSEFEKYYEKQTGSKISLQPFRDSKKRPDFVMSGFDGLVQIIEIKQPGHRLGKDEWLRIRTYIENITSFLNDPANAEFKRHFTGYKITLVCDELGLTGDAQDAYRLYEQAGSITLIGWKTFLLRARQMHEEFLEKYRQLKEIVGRDE